MLVTNPPIHPGEILRTEFMQPLGLTAGRIAKALHVPRTRIERLAQGQTALTTDTAMRLGRYFGTGSDFWLNLRGSYDLSLAHQDVALQGALAQIKPVEVPEQQGKAA